MERKKNNRTGKKQKKKETGKEKKTWKDFS